MFTRSVAPSIVILLVILLMVVVVDVYWSDKLTFEITDAHTGEPLADVIVVADWVASAGHGVTTNRMLTVELTSGADGFAEIEEWGPAIDFGRGKLSDRQPTIRMYKEGYIPKIVTGLNVTNGKNGFAKSQLTAGDVVVKIRLLRSQGDRINRERELDSLVSSLSNIVSGFECGWRETPQILIALHREREILLAHDLGSTLVNLNTLGNQRKCGIATEIFGEEI